MGIGGSGMSGIARLADKMGYHVTGCDLEGSTAYADNIFKGHDVKHLDGADYWWLPLRFFIKTQKIPNLSRAKNEK